MRFLKESLIEASAERVFAFHEAPDAFRRWIDRAAQVSRLRNPPAIVHQNLHKSYLADLAGRGQPVIPTEFLVRGEAADLAALMTTRGWDDVVIKPAISAASYRTRRFRTAETAAGQEFLADLLADRDAMVQRYMTAVENGGEKALVWIDGAFTHAVRKAVRFAGQAAHLDIQFRPVTEYIRNLGKVGMRIHRQRLCPGFKNNRIKTHLGGGIPGHLRDRQ